MMGSLCSADVTPVGVQSGSGLVRSGGPVPVGPVLVGLVPVGPVPVGPYGGTARSFEGKTFRKP